MDPREQHRPGVRRGAFPTPPADVRRAPTFEPVPKTDPDDGTGAGTDDTADAPTTGTDDATSAPVPDPTTGPDPRRPS